MSKYFLSLPLFLSLFWFFPFFSLICCFLILNLNVKHFSNQKSYFFLWLLQLILHCIPYEQPLNFELLTSGECDICRNILELDSSQFLRSSLFLQTFFFSNFFLTFFLVCSFYFLLGLIKTLFSFRAKLSVPKK